MSRWPARPRGLAPAVRALRARWPVEAVRTAFLLAWARQAAVPARRVEVHGAGEPGAALAQIGAWGLDLGLPALVTVFEVLLDDAHRVAQGAVYTPDFVVDHILATAWDLAQPGRAPEICDPACGVGAFLLRGAALLQERCGIGPREAFERHLIGVDNDPEALRWARCLLDLCCAAAGEDCDPSAFVLKQADTLLTTPEALRATIGRPDGVDLVVANPPYVKLQNLPPAYRRDLEAVWGAVLRGSYALAPLFLLQGRELLAPGGVMGAITQNNLFTSAAGAGVRAQLQATGALRRVIDFGDAHVFSEASAYTALVFLGREAAQAVEVGRCPAPSGPAALANTALASLPQAALGSGRWRLVSGRHTENIRRIEGVGRPLGEKLFIRVGVATLADKVFLLRVDEDGVRALDGSGPPLEGWLTRPLNKVADLDGSPVGGAPNRAVLFPYEKVDGRWALIPEGRLADAAPRAYAHLQARAELLGRRDKGSRSYPAWYAWGRTQSMEAPGPKLLTKTFSQGPAFFLDPSDALFCNGYALSWREPAAKLDDLRLLQRILHSAVMDYYMRLTSVQIEGGFQCYQKNFLATFGLPSWSAAERDALLGLEGPDWDAALYAWYGLEPADLAEFGAFGRGAR